MRDGRGGFYDGGQRARQHRGNKGDGGDCIVLALDIGSNATAGGTEAGWNPVSSCLRSAIQKGAWERKCQKIQ